MEAKQEGEEVQKTPQEKYLDMIYDKNKSKEERAKLIINILEPNSSHSWENEDGSKSSPINRYAFYEPDFFRNNGYTHVIINFTEKGDEELFKKLTMFILSDIKKDNFIVDPNGMQTELFETTVRSSI